MAHWNSVELLFLLLCGHMVGDFALQTEWVATHKNRHMRDQLLPSEKETFQVIWPHLLTAHSAIHGVIVFLITQNLLLGVAELVAHWLIDYAKCEKWIGFHTDQFLHLGSKVLWLILLSTVLA